LFVGNRRQPVRSEPQAIPSRSQRICSAHRGIVPSPWNSQAWRHTRAIVGSEDSERRAGGGQIEPSCRRAPKMAFGANDCARRSALWAGEPLSASLRSADLLDQCDFRCQAISQARRARCSRERICGDSASLVSHATRALGRRLQRHRANDAALGALCDVIAPSHAAPGSRHRAS